LPGLEQSRLLRTLSAIGITRHAGNKAQAEIYLQIYFTRLPGRDTLLHETGLAGSAATGGAGGRAATVLFRRGGAFARAFLGAAAGATAGSGGLVGKLE